jgi:hypothetical protein
MPIDYLHTRDEILRFREEMPWPDADFGTSPNPQDVSTPQDLYSVGAKFVDILVMTLEGAAERLDLEIVQHMKVAPDRRSQLLVASLNGHFDTDIVVVKLFDPVYISEEELCLTRSPEWVERVNIAESLCDAEFGAYQALTELQGKLIPICYGRITLTISGEERKVRNAHEVHGVILQKLPVVSHVFGHELEPEERVQFIDNADAILHEVHRLGMTHQDVAPRNFCLDASRHMYLLDFEAAEPLNEDPEIAESERENELIEFENYAKLYGFLPKNIDWKYTSASKAQRNSIPFHNGVNLVIGPYPCGAKWAKRELNITYFGEEY